MSARDAVIVAAKRTPLGVGKATRGIFRDVHAVDLSAQLLRGLVDDAGIDPGLIEDVMWGCVTQVGEQSTNIGRNAALAAGFPESVVGMTIDRQCGSSQQAILTAAATLKAGYADVLVAGGVEVMSRTPMFSNAGGGEDPFGPMVNERYPGLVPQGLSAEAIATKWNLDRGYLDQLAVDSHQKAADARERGYSAAEIIPVRTPEGLQSEDQGIRPGTNIDVLAGLKSPFVEGGAVTAGNASQISDGSAAVLMMTAEKARELGLKPIARVHTAVMAGSDPVMMLTAPMPATSKVLDRAGLQLEDIGAFEVNEAFASVVGAWLSDTGANYQLLNPRGGAMALGHPLGASGARITVTLLHHMRENGIRYGLQTMCEGGGMANATIYELL